MKCFVRRELLGVLALGLASPALAEEVAPAPDASISEPQPLHASPWRPRMHLSAGGVADVQARRAGVELGATFDVASTADLGLGVSLGESIGLLTLAQFHIGLPEESLFRPFVQLRGEFHFASRGYGGGAWAGLEMELGAGRLKAGPGYITFAPREGYRSYAVLALAGFELDFRR